MGLSTSSSLRLLSHSLRYELPRRYLAVTELDQFFQDLGMQHAASIVAGPTNSFMCVCLHSANGSPADLLLQQHEAQPHQSCYRQLRTSDGATEGAGGDRLGA